MVQKQIQKTESTDVRLGSGEGVAVGRGGPGVTADRCRVPFWGLEILWMRRCGCTTLWVYSNPWTIHLKMVSVCCVNYIAIKVLWRISECDGKFYVSTWLVTGCLEVWFNIYFSGVSVRVFPEAINSSGLSKVHCPALCGWATSNPLRMWTKQKGEGREDLSLLRDC